eukprot:5818008-Amphidinium_carterae.1
MGQAGNVRQNFALGSAYKSMCEVHCCRSCTLLPSFAVGVALRSTRVRLGSPDNPCDLLVHADKNASEEHCCMMTLSWASVWA